MASPSASVDDKPDMSLRCGCACDSCSCLKPFHQREASAGGVGSGGLDDAQDPEGCCGCSECGMVGDRSALEALSSGVREVATAAADGIFVIGITGMTCGHCVQAVTDGLRKLRHIDVVSVSLEANNALVTAVPGMVRVMQCDVMWFDVILFFALGVGGASPRSSPT